MNDIPKLGSDEYKRLLRRGQEIESMPRNELVAMPQIEFAQLSAELTCINELLNEAELHASYSDKVDDFSDSLALHDDPFGVLGSLAEMEDVEASMRWAGATL